MNHRTVIFLLAIFLALPACSIRQDYPDTKRYAFDVRREGPPREPVAGTCLIVAPFDASRRYAGEQMVYRLKDGTWEADFYNRFFIAPAEMITEEAARWFGDARLTEAVLDISTLADATHGIEGNLTSLLGDYSGDEGPHAVLSMQMVALGRKPDGGLAMLVSAEYEKRIPVADRTSDALIDGWERALREVFTDFEERLAKVLAADGEDESR